MLQVTEDTPPDMLSGAMDLTVHLPNGRAVKMAVERSTPMMDLLVQITTAHRLQLSGHTLEPLGMSGEDVALPYKPNTPIGTLDTRRVRVVPKQPRAAAAATGAAVVPRNVPPGQRPFESTFRLKVHLPRNQLYVTRVSRDVTLGEVVAKVCDEKDLDAAKYELRHPANLDQVLDLKRSLSDYKITEIYVVCRGSNDLNRAFSTNDIMALRKEEERKQLHTKTGGGVFNLIFRRGAAKSSIGSGSVSSDARSISPAPSDESRSVTPPQPAAPPPQAPPKPPTRKRRQAPPPPPQAAGAGPGASGAGPPEPQICHSRNSSDSSGYHEASVLSDTLPRRPRSAFVAADGAARAEPGAEGEEPRGAGLSKEYSRSTTNLSKMAYHSKSTTSLGVPPGRKKKAAPPPPPAVLRASNPTINVEPASPIAVVASRAVATPTDAAREDQHACPVVAPQAPQVVVANAPPVPRSRLSRPAPAPRGRRVDVVAEEAQHQVAPEKPARQRATSPGSESPTEPPGHQVEPEGHLERPKTSGSSPREEIPSTTGQSEDPINVTKDPAVSAISDTKKDLENPSQTPPVDECRISDTRSDLENPSTTSPVDESPISYTKSNLENPIEAQSVDESNAKSALENPRITPPADECPISDTTSDLKNPNKTSPVDESPITYTNSDLENPTEAQTVDKSPITYTKIDLENPTEAQSVAESTISYTTSNLKNPSQTPSLDHSPNNLQQRFEPEPTRPKVAVIGALQKKTSRDIFSSAEFLVAGAPPPEVDLLEDDVVVYAGAKRPSSASHAGHGVESPPERYSRTTSVTSLRSLLGQPGGLKKWRNVEDLDDVSTASWTAGDQSETESFSSHQLDSLVSISSGHDVPRCFGSTDSGIAQELADHRATSPPPPPLLDDLPPSPPPPPPGVESPRSSTRAPELTRVETPALEVVPPPPLPEPDDPTPPPPPGVVSPRSSALAPEVTRVETPAFEVVPPPPLLPEPSPPPPPPLDLPVDVVSDEQDAAWPPSPPRAFRDEEAAPVPVVERPELAARLLELQEAETPMNKLSLENLERRRSLVYNREIANSLKMADTFSGSISRFESTYAEVHRRSAATTTTTTSTSSSTTHLPNFRISTYDRPKERIKVFEDDTVRSNANATPWTPSRPVSRSRSQVALNGRHQVEEEKVVVERAPAGREGVSRSNSLYDVSGLQSLGVMRLIQTKLGASLNRDDAAAAAATPASLDAAPQVRPTAAYRYRGPPTVNMGTWSDRPKGGPVSVQGDAAVSSRLVVSTRSDSMPGGDVAVVTRGPRSQDPYRRRPLGALQADVSRVPPIVRSVELKKPFRDLEEAATAKRSEGPGPVVRGFRTGYPWATLPRREEAVRVPSAPAPPPPTMPQEATRRRSVPREDARDQLLSAIRNFGGKKGLRSVNA